MGACRVSSVGKCRGVSVDIILLASVDNIIYRL
jgi:hypothetical protein